MKMSQTYFEQSFTLDKHCIVSLLGQAMLKFSMKEFSSSAAILKHALKLNPGLPGKARLGLGYCFYHLNKIPMAEYAFRRVLQLDSANIDAIIGLALIKLR